jgi:3-dehydroquinate synthetase
VLTYDPKESTKRFETLVQWYAAHRPEYRRLWSIGGGITSDLAGFYCGLLGLGHHATPTTLLSAFDASIGGKTAANFPPWGKNQIGLFHETTAFVMATEHFSTLSAEAIFSALAESIKHIWLAGSKGLEHLDTIEDLCNQMLTHGADPQAQAAANLPRWLWQGDALQNAILFNQNVKSCFVELDPYESGPRMALNFGHTLAHVLEALADEGWLRELPHGLAVAVGMKFMLTSGLMIDPHADRFVRVLDKLLCCTGSMPPFVVTKPDATRTAQPPGHQTKDMDPKSFWDRFATLAQADKKSASRSTGQSGSEAAVTFVMPPFGYGANLKSTQNLQKPTALLSCNEFLELCQQHKIFVFDT